jgi:hypothetical protein
MGTVLSFVFNVGAHHDAPSTRKLELGHPRAPCFALLEMSLEPHVYPPDFFVVQTKKSSPLFHMGEIKIVLLEFFRFSGLNLGS